MKNIFLLLFLGGLLSACGARKQVADTQATQPSVVIDDKVTVPQQPEPPNPPAPPQEEVIEVEEIIEEAIESSEEEVEETVVTDTASSAVLFDHSSYDALLTQYVSPEGNVNYAGFKSQWSVLQEYIKALGAITPDDSWSQEDQLAYWMNAYNALTVDLILRHYPLASIKDIKDPWGQRFWKLGDKWVNLNEIEHEILRKKGDPRIHFGINCASFSCPPLLNEAFTTDRVDAQLDDLARRFINDSKRNTITANSIEVSKIFNWFAKDFKTNGSLIDYLNTYSEIPIAANAKRRYKDYDWSLNK